MALEWPSAVPNGPTDFGDESVTILLNFFQPVSERSGYHSEGDGHEN